MFAPAHDVGHKFSMDASPRRDSAEKFGLQNKPVHKVVDGLLGFKR